MLISWCLATVTVAAVAGGWRESRARVVRDYLHNTGTWPHHCYIGGQLLSAIVGSTDNILLQLIINTHI